MYSECKCNSRPRDPSRREGPVRSVGFSTGEANVEVGERALPSPKGRFSDAYSGPTFLGVDWISLFFLFRGMGPRRKVHSRFCNSQRTHLSLPASRAQRDLRCRHWSQGRLHCSGGLVFCMVLVKLRDHDQDEQGPRVESKRRWHEVERRRVG